MIFASLYARVERAYRPKANAVQDILTTMNPTLLKSRTHCPKGQDLSIHGYYFGTNQRCGACNRKTPTNRSSTTEKPTQKPMKYKSVQLFPSLIAEND